MSVNVGDLIGASPCIGVELPYPVGQHAVQIVDMLSRASMITPQEGAEDTQV